MLEVPETRFTKLGKDRIAFQVLGDGPVDLLYVTAGDIAMGLRWDFLPYAAFLHGLASFSRLIMFDRRGSGASDSASEEVLPAWERWEAEIQAVMDAVGSERAAMMAEADAGPTAILFAALLPERTQSLVLCNTTARFLADDDYPGQSERVLDAINEVARVGVQGEKFARISNPDALRDPGFLPWSIKSGLLSVRPRERRAHYRWMALADLRDVLPSIGVPTLVVHREHTQAIPLAHGRYLAGHIPGARLVIVPGADGAMYSEPHDETMRAIAEFVTGTRLADTPDRALAAVLFTDIIGSTEHAAALGDGRWRKLLDTHDAVAGSVIDQYRGKLIKLTGDGVLATFDGPGRAIRCAASLREALRPLGIRIKAGLHTGEVELRGDDIGGIGVHVAARVLEWAEADDLLTSAAVPMLVAGSGIEFEDRGDHELKGIPGTWKLFAVRG